MGSHTGIAGRIWLGKGSHILVFKKKKHCKNMIIYIIYHVCVFVLIVLSNYVDKYININKCFLYIYFLWFLSDFLSLKKFLKGWGCWAVVASRAKGLERCGVVGSGQREGLGVMGTVGCRAAGGIEGDGYGGVQGRGLGDDNGMRGFRGNGVQWVPVQRDRGAVGSGVLGAVRSRTEGRGARGRSPPAHPVPAGVWRLHLPPRGAAPGPGRAGLRPPLSEAPPGRGRWRRAGPSRARVRPAPGRGGAGGAPGEEPGGLPMRRRRMNQLYIGNLSPAATAQDLRQLFGERQLPLPGQVLLKSGYAFVDYPDQNWAIRAIETLSGERPPPRPPHPPRDPLITPPAAPSPGISWSPLPSLLSLLPSLLPPRLFPTSPLFFADFFLRFYWEPPGRGAPGPAAPPPPAPPRGPDYEVPNPNSPGAPSGGGRGARGARGQPGGAGGSGCGGTRWGGMGWDGIWRGDAAVPHPGGMLSSPLSPQGKWSCTAK